MWACLNRPILYGTPPLCKGRWAAKGGSEGLSDDPSVTA